MAHLLIVTRGLPSLVYPSVELARRLAAEGHRVTFAGDEPARSLAMGHGLDFLPLDPDQYDAFLAADRAAPWIARCARVRGRRTRARASLSEPGFAAALERARPDLVLINGEMHAHIMTAAAAGLRVALLNSFVSIWRAPGLPPPHHVARPGGGWKGTAIGMSLLWANLRIQKLRRRSLARVRDAGVDRVSMLHDLARTTGLEDSLDAGQWLIPFTYRRFPVLSLHALEFEFRHRPPGHVHYVGPMILQSRGDREMSPADRDRLDALLEGRRDAASGRTLVYAGFGSVLSADPAFLRRLIGIVEERPHWDLILSLSGRRAPSSLGPMPARTHVFSWIPQLEVLALADVAITHGGISTIDECVMNGVPVLVYAGGETDMGGTTSRAVHHGLGIEGNRDRDSTDAIRSHVDRLLAESRYRSAVTQLQRIYAGYAERHVAERTIEALLAAPVSPLRARV